MHKMQKMIIEGSQNVQFPAHWNFGKYILYHFRNATPLDVCLENYSTGEQLTYGEFIKYAVSLSVALSGLGVAKGDVVGVGSEKRIKFLPTTLAVVFSGAAYTPFDLETGRAALKHKLTLSRPNYFICSALFWKAYSDIIKSDGFVKTIICFEAIQDIDLSIEKLIAIPAEVNNFEPAIVEGTIDTALILYSSGTTGMPKGVLFTHSTCILSSLPNEFQDGFLKTALLYGEWYHAYDIFFSYAILCAGKKVVYTPELSNSPNLFLKIVCDYQVDCAVIVPSLVGILAKAEEVDKDNLSSLKIIYSGGAPLSTTIIETVLRRFPELMNLHQIYGMTEVGGITSGSHGTKGSKIGSVGMAYPAIKLKIVDPKTREILGSNQRGEICIRSPCLMRGYIGMDSSDFFDKEGFFSTGDLGYYDEDSYVYIVDRMKDVFFYNGEQVAPLELETILLSHPGVREAAVVGKPAGDYGEQPAAFVVRQPGAALTEQDLLDFVAPEVSPCSQLRGGVIFVPELPRNSMGKILRRQLKEML